MHRFFKASTLIALIGASLGIYSFLSAQAPPSSVKESLQGTYIDEGYYQGGFTTEATVDTPIGTPLAVTCPGSTTCTIQADMFVQSGGTHFSGNTYAICLWVDGVRGPNCQDVGSTAPDNTYLVGSTSQLVAGVTPGNHVVQTYVGAKNGMIVFNHTSNYRVYKP
jgi:hypothetical protein